MYVSGGASPDWPGGAAVRVDAFDFELPQESIAQHAVARGDSRLFVVAAPAGGSHQLR